MKERNTAGTIYCRILNKKIKISKEGYANSERGFICDCGRWTGDYPNQHTVYWKGRRL